MTESNQDSSHLIQLDPFPKMPVSAALQFADEKSTTGGIMTCAALDALAAEVRGLRMACEDWKKLANTGGNKLNHKVRECDSLREALSAWKEWWECKSVGNGTRGPIYIKTIEALSFGQNDRETLHRENQK